MRTRAGGFFLAALVLGSCGSDEDRDAAATTTSTTKLSTTTTTTTSTTTTTTTPATPIEVYEDRLRGRLTTDDEGYRSMVTLGESVCSAIGAAVDAAEEDAPNDTPESDAMVIELAASTSVGLAMEAFDDPRAGAIFLRTTTYYLCPEHEGVVETQLESRGL